MAILIVDVYRGLVDGVYTSALEPLDGFTMHIGMSLEEYVGDAKSCVCHDNPKALRQLVKGVFSPEDIFTDDWVYPAGAFRGSEGGPC